MTAGNPASEEALQKSFMKMTAFITTTQAKLWIIVLDAE